MYVMCGVSGLGEEELGGGREQLGEGREQMGVERGGQRTGLRGQVAPILADFGEVNGYNSDRLLSWAIAEILSRRVLNTLSGKK